MLAEVGGRVERVLGIEYIASAQMIAKIMGVSVKTGVACDFCMKNGVVRANASQCDHFKRGCADVS